MLLQDKNAVVYGAGGVLGGAAAQAFARAGARVVLAGRTRAKLEVVAKEIAEAGGRAEIAEVDALDERAVGEHAAETAARLGGIDVSLNAIGVDHVQGAPLVELSAEDFALPIATYTRTQFVTGTAAGRLMAARGSGVILTISTSAARRPDAPSSGFGTACAAVEAFSRQLATELGPRGVRVLCLRPDGMPETARRGSHAINIWRRFADRLGITLDEFLDQPSQALLGHGPAPEDVANVAVFLASAGAGALTGSVTDISGGAVIDF